jgi:nitric oxide synthase oxygenase domain/subunit
VPPEKKTRFDLLPVVVMAEGDLPVIIELPAHLRRLIEIRHPQYPEAFAKLDLKWAAFPALSRLGFDIGGVQYTASPFIGW